MVRLLTILVAIWCGAGAWAGIWDTRFQSIDGGHIDMSDFEGRPVLVVNTASLCAFTDQYADLQALYDEYRDAGLVVLAVPSADFRQELDTGEEVQEFCELTYGIDMPMADITPVTGRDAHPFYKTVREATGFVPRWNFNKVLVGPDGTVIETWGARDRPTSPQITGPIRALLEC